MLVSRRTAPRAAHCVPSERLRDDGYWDRCDASVLQPLASGSTELVSKKAAIAADSDPQLPQKFLLKACEQRSSSFPALERWSRP